MCVFVCVCVCVCSLRQIWSPHYKINEWLTSYPMMNRKKCCSYHWRIKNLKDGIMEKFQSVWYSACGPLSYRRCFIYNSSSVRQQHHISNASPPIIKSKRFGIISTSKLVLKYNLYIFHDASFVALSTHGLPSKREGYSTKEEWIWTFESQGLQQETYHPR